LCVFFNAVIMDLEFFIDNSVCFFCYKILL